MLTSTDQNGVRFQEIQTRVEGATLDSRIDHQVGEIKAIRRHVKKMRPHTDVMLMGSLPWRVRTLPRNAVSTLITGLE